MSMTPDHPAILWQGDDEPAAPALKPTIKIRGGRLAVSIGEQTAFLRVRDGANDEAAAFQRALGDGIKAILAQRKRARQAESKMANAEARERADDQKRLNKAWKRDMAALGIPNS